MQPISLTSRTSRPVPSLDTIRTVRVRGQADGVDAATAALNKLSASIQAANDNLMRTGVAAKEASDGWSITGEGALSAANRLRQAAEAAYAFSPAFRGVVNDLAVPALRDHGAGTRGARHGPQIGRRLDGGVQSDYRRHHRLDPVAAIAGAAADRPRA